MLTVLFAVVIFKIESQVFAWPEPYSFNLCLLCSWDDRQVAPRPAIG
jgi:hypothetical protein